MYECAPLVRHRGVRQLRCSPRAPDSNTFDKVVEYQARLERLVQATRKLLNHRDVRRRVSSCSKAQKNDLKILLRSCKKYIFKTSFFR